MAFVVVAGAPLLAVQEPAARGGCGASNEKCEEENLALWVPPGTESWNVSDNEVRFKLPEGYVVWSRQSDGTLLKMEEGGVTCECAEGDCNPFKQGGVYYCAVGPKCTSCCKRKASAEMSVVVTSANGTVGWATPEDRATLPMASPALLEIPEIQRAVRKFVKAAHQGKPQSRLNTKGNGGTAPAGYTLVPVNIYGYIANALVPKETAKTLKCEVEQAATGKMEDGECGEAKDKCKCNSGTTGCKYWSSMLGVSGCESGACTSCTMSSSEE